MVRPRKEETMETVSIRLPAVMLEEIDLCTYHLKEDRPLLDVTRGGRDQVPDSGG